MPAPERQTGGEALHYLYPQITLRAVTPASGVAPPSNNSISVNLNNSESHFVWDITRRHGVTSGWDPSEDEAFVICHFAFRQTSAHLKRRGRARRRWILAERAVRTVGQTRRT